MGPNVVSPLLRSVCVSTCIVLMLGMMLGLGETFVTCVPRAACRVTLLRLQKIRRTTSSAQHKLTDGALR